MPRFRFSLGRPSAVREVGFVHSPSFSEGLTTIAEHGSPEVGDTLEISVEGFPPAKFEWIWFVDDGAPTWRPTGQLAA